LIEVHPDLIGEPAVSEIRHTLTARGFVFVAGLSDGQQWFLRRRNGLPPAELPE